jgi:hypothetical protein
MRTLKDMIDQMAIDECPDEFIEGQQAYEKGKYTNPHNPGSIKYIAWFEGYRIAKAEDE